MSKEVVVKKSGISFLGLLTVLFVGLKLTNFITWSWIWVLAPVWIPIAVGLGIALIALIFMGIIAIFSK